MSKYYDSGLRLKDFKKGDRVRYVPASYKEKPERGVVSSVGAVYVFVKYDNASGKMITGDEPYTAQATSIIGGGFFECENSIDSLIALNIAIVVAVLDFLRKEEGYNNA